MKINQITYLVFNPQVGFLLNFASRFSFMTYSLSKIFQLKHYKLWTKTAHQCSSFQTLESSKERSSTSTCHFWNCKVEVSSICITLRRHQDISTVFFSSSLIYFRQKDPIEVNFSNFWVLEWELKFLMSHLKLEVNFSLDFVSLFSVMIGLSDFL